MLTVPKPLPLALIVFLAVLMPVLHSRLHYLYRNQLNDQGLREARLGHFKAADRLWRAGLNGERDLLFVKLVNNLDCHGRSKKGWMELEPLCRESLGVCRRIYGESSPASLPSIQQLAHVIWRFDQPERYPEVEAQLEQVVRICKSHFGDTHQKTLDAIKSLASFYCCTNRSLDKAESLRIRVLNITYRKYGAEHQNTIIALLDLANAYCKSNQIKDADTCFLTAMERTTKAYGDEHNLTRRVRLSFMEYLESHGRYDEAEPLELKELEIETRLRPGFNTVCALNSVGLLYYGSQRYEEAARRFQQALSLFYKCRTTEGNLPPALYMKNLARVYTHMERLSEAEELYKESIRLQLEGSFPVLAANTMVELGLVHKRQHRYDEAIELITKALQIYVPRSQDDEGAFKQDALDGIVKANTFLADIRSECDSTKHRRSN